MLRSFKINFQMLGDDCQTPYLDLINARIDKLLLGDGEKSAISSHDIPPLKDVLAEIEPTEDEDLLHRLLVTPPIIIWLCSANTIPGETGTDWESFLRTRFGRKVPVEVLDPGIALLVKTLPLLGLDTVMSCEGHMPGEIKGSILGEWYGEASEHDDNVPTVNFLSKYHLKWAQRVVPQFLPESDPFITQWTFEEEPGWSGCQWRLAPAGSITNSDKKFEVFKNIQRLARGILENHWNAEGCYDPENSLVHKLRDYKRELTSPRDLESPGLGDKIARLCR